MGFSVVPGIVVLAYVVYYSCHMAGQGSFWLIPSDTLHGRSVAGGLAMVNTIGQMGSFFGPVAWGLAQDHTGSYQLGLISVSFSFMAAAMLLLLIRRTALSAKTTAAAIA
jgi:MFS transporter, ACS family, tartrate transporter